MSPHGAGGAAGSSGGAAGSSGGTSSFQNFSAFGGAVEEGVVKEASMEVALLFFIVFCSLFLDVKRVTLNCKKLCK